jgi:hypothetical protein
MQGSTNVLPEEEIRKVAAIRIETAPAAERGEQQGEADGDSEPGQWLRMYRSGCFIQKFTFLIS